MSFRASVLIGDSVPGHTRRSPSVGKMFAQRRRRWANIVPSLGERFVFAGWLLALVDVTILFKTLVLLNCLFIFFIHLKMELLTQFPAFK